MSGSVESARTISDRDLEGRFGEEVGLETPINLDHLEIPDGESSHTFDFLNDVEAAAPVDPPLSPHTVRARAKVVAAAAAFGANYFYNKPNLCYTSVYASRRVDWEKMNLWVDGSVGYRCEVPSVGAHMWESPEFGMHGIPKIHFEFGLRLPMHPFHLAVFEALGCGVAQIVPNSIAQMSGFVALCAEKNRVPELRLFFSLYGIRYSEGQVYFEKLTRRAKIVSVLSSNSGWHGKWLFWYGPDLELIRPCGEVSRAAIDALHSLEKYSVEELDEFQGANSWFTLADLKNERFLASHNRKGLVLKL